MRKPIPKIAFVALYGQVSGAEISLSTLIAHLDRERFTPLLILPSDASDACFADLDVEIRRLPLRPIKRSRNPLNLPRRCFSILRMSFRMARLLKQEGVALVHSNSYKAHLYTGWAAKWAGIPATCHFRDCLPNNGGLRYFLRSTTKKIVFVSRFIASQTKMQERGDVVYNPIDFPPAFSLETDSAPRVLANIGQLVPWKRQDEFVDLSHRLHAADPGLSFQLIGRSPEKGLHADAAVAPYLKHVPWQDSPEQLWSGIDVLVHCAEKEPFGRVVAEAQWMGIPVVAALGGGNSELIADGEDGLLYQGGNLPELVDTVQRLLQEADLREQLSRKGMEKARQAYCPQKHARRMEEIFAAVL